MSYMKIFYNLLCHYSKHQLHNILVEYINIVWLNNYYYSMQLLFYIVCIYVDIKTIEKKKLTLIRYF